jgi:flagellar motility protein MotE (MotC chaperone)
MNALRKSNDEINLIDALEVIKKLQEENKKLKQLARQYKDDWADEQLERHVLQEENKKLKTIVKQCKPDAIEEEEKSKPYTFF